MKVVSGGQTGVDRAALDAAIALGIEHGGYCPKGRLAEDGAIDAKYLLRETASRHYPVRTEKNVVHSDGTLILYRKSLRGGTRLTKQLADKHKQPVLTLDVANVAVEDIVACILRWLREASIEVLNVAGPRESSCPGIGAQARHILETVLADHCGV